MTFEEVDEQLTMPRYNSLCRFWSKHPPTQVLLAGYVGYKASEKTAPAGGEISELDEESMQELAKVFGMPIKGNGK